MKTMFKILTSVILIGFATQVNAQKVFSTKSGQLLFNASGGIETIAAVNNQVDSKLSSATGQFVMAALIKGFKFENQLMEDHFNENYMESTKFPSSDFKGYITNIKDIDFSKDGTYAANFDGNLTIHGVVQKVTTRGQIKVKQGKTNISGEFSIKLKDYGISGSYIGDKIAGSVTIRVNCTYQN